MAAAAEQRSHVRAKDRLIVLDTNVWLDIHFFRDPQAKPLAVALESPHWATARCEQTDAELSLVLTRPPFGADPTERLRLLDCAQRWRARSLVFWLDAQAPYRCRDPHDQKFLDLAHVAQASLLLTKDKALLSVQRSARQHGLTILTPRQFARLLPLLERAEPAEHLDTIGPTLSSGQTNFRVPTR
jgi:predicted nucleic acid-binding protein